MANPELRYSYNDGRMASDFVSYEAGEAIIDARLVRYPDGRQVWLDRSGLALQETLQANGQETNQSAEESGQSNGRIQSRDAQKRQTRTGQRSKGKKPQASNSDSVV